MWIQEFLSGEGGIQAEFTEKVLTFFYLCVFFFFCYFSPQLISKRGQGELKLVGVGGGGCPIWMETYRSFNFPCGVQDPPPHPWIRTYERLLKTENCNNDKGPLCQGKSEFSAIHGFPGLGLLLPENGTPKFGLVSFF